MLAISTGLVSERLGVLQQIVGWKENRTALYHPNLSLSDSFVEVVVVLGRGVRGSNRKGGLGSSFQQKLGKPHRLTTTHTKAVHNTPSR
jgi:hypothetical protein